MSRLRKWENLELDCLLNILGRVGTDSLLLDVPFVCKSWYKASLDPSVWKSIDLFGFCEYPFSSLHRFKDQYKINNFSLGGLVRLVVTRGLGKSNSLVLPRRCRLSDVEYVTEKSSELKSLSVHRLFIQSSSIFPSLIGRLSMLEELKLRLYFPKNFPGVIAQISINCENFGSLSYERGPLTEEVARAISIYLPKIKKLSLISCYVEQEYLEIILRACKDLEFFEVSECKISGGFWDENTIRSLASHIKTVKLEATHFGENDEYGDYVNAITLEEEDVSDEYSDSDYFL